MSEKFIPHFPGYSIESDGKIGKVNSYWCFAEKGNGRAKRKIGEYKRTLKHRLGKAGYAYVNIYKEGVRYTVKIHRLLALNFLEPVKDKNIVCHKDGQKTNNNLNNLYWGSLSDNQQDSLSHKTHSSFSMRGSICPWAKLKDSQVLKIFYLKGKLSGVEVCQMFNISLAQVSRIQNKKNWKHLTVNL